MKSIYEEVLEIIDRNIFELPEGFGILYEIRKKIEQALKQAQKQENLLELYRQLNNLPRNNTWSWKLDNEIKKIQNKIKELENEI